MDRRPLFGGKPDSTSFVERLARPAVFGACFRVGLFHLELFVKIQQNVENWNVSVLDSAGGCDLVRGFAAGRKPGLFEFHVVRACFDHLGNWMCQ